MKNYSLLLLAFLLNGSLFAQTKISTGKVELWSATSNIGCHAAPLSSGSIAALSFSATPVNVCNGINSPTGNSNLGTSASTCLIPDSESHVFRTTVNANSQACLATYNFSADNAFRIYVNGNSSPTNVLPASPPSQPSNGVCGNQYSGNDWNTAFTGTLNNPDFLIGNNNIDFETTNGVSSGGSHPYWLSGDLLFWQFSDLNSIFTYGFDYDPITGTVTLNYQTLPQTNGALYSIVVERSFSYPSSPVWSPFFSITSSNKKAFKINPCPPVPNMFCDENGAAVRITLTAMAGACQNSTTHIWTCANAFGGGPIEQIEHTTSSTDNPNFTLTSEQIKDIHAQYREKLALDQNLNFSLDSIFAASEGQSKLQVFPNPSNGHIWINTTEREEGPTPIKIFNQIGALVFEDRIQGRQEIDLSELPNGLYFLKSFQEKSGSIHSTQFILQR